MTTATLATTFETIERDGVTYVYDQPQHTVYVKGFAFGRFLLLLAGFECITLLMFADAMTFDQAGPIAFLFGIASFFMAFRFARLSTLEPSWWQAVSRNVLGFAILGVALLAGQWLAHAMNRVLLLGFLVRWSYYFGAAVVLILMFISTAATIAGLARTEVKALPRIIVPVANLHDRLTRMQADIERQDTPSTFDADDPALVTAWEKKNTDSIERLLRAGDDLNRQSWQAAIGVFNAAKDDIDLARGRLRHLVKEADAALAGYHIDYDALTIDRSGVLHGEMSEASLPAKDFMQKLDYSRGMGMAVSKAVTGNGPWQVAAAAVIFSGVMMAVNHQKLLLQLKELEGQVKTQAEAVRGDCKLIADTLSQRLIPQFEGVLALITRLEDGLQSLHDAEAHAPKDAEEPKATAFQLACIFREAQYLLEMKAGN